MQQRIEYLDTMKGLAIILMVMGHTLAWNYADYSSVVVYMNDQPSNVKIGGLLWQFIYSFHMALFFMISGFLSFKRDGQQQPVLAFLKKKCHRLLIPWIVTFGIAYFLRGDKGYWFLLSLFELSIFGYVFIYVSTKLKINNIFVDLMIIALSWFGLQSISRLQLLGVDVGRFANDLLPFCIGILLHKYNRFYRLCLENEYFNFSLVLLYLFLFVSRYLQDYSMIFHYVYNYSSILMSVFGPLIVWHMFSNLNKNEITNTLSRLGGKTLPIYILHMAFVIQIPAIGDFILEQSFASSITIQLTYSLVFASIAIFWSLIVYNILERNRFVRAILFGE